MAQELNKVSKNMIDDSFTSQVDNIETQLAETISEIKKTKNENTSIEDFPVIGPEIDDTARIQRALADTKTNILVLPKGTYNFSRTLNLRSNISVVGHFEESFLTTTDPQITAFDGLNLSNVFISGIKLKAMNTSSQNTVNAIGINLRNCINAYVENVFIDNFNVGIQFYRCTKARAFNNTVQNSVTNLAGVTGYGINTDGSTDVLCIGNRIYNCERHGFYAGSSDATNYRAKRQTFIGNLVFWDKAYATPSTYQSGFKTFNSDYVTIANNHVNGTKHGVWIPEGAVSPKVTGNTIVNINEIGFFIANGVLTLVDVEFKNNTIDIVKNTSGANGQGVLNGGTAVIDGITIDNNTIKNCATKGIQCTTFKKYSITNNKIRNCVEGMRFAAGQEVGIVDNNYLINCGTALVNLPAGSVGINLTV